MVCFDFHELQASPEFKGIKTRLVREHGRALRLQASPEFKGIKTRVVYVLCNNYSFKPALNSKGLRLVSATKKNAIELQASPEFKGIKTVYLLLHPEFPFASSQP